MDQDSQRKYEGFKLSVKVWEDEFKKKNKRIPSKVSWEMDFKIPQTLKINK
jgi:hypothetical protein